MESKEFKKAFCEMAKQFGFKTAFGCCYKQSTECLFVLELQKSYYSNLYYLNMKTYIQGTFGKEYTIHKDYLKKDMGNIFSRPTKPYASIFDLEADMSDEARLALLNAFFHDYMSRYAEKNLTVAGIRELAELKELYLIDNVENELNRLYPVDVQMEK